MVWANLKCTVISKQPAEVGRCFRSDRTATISVFQVDAKLVTAAYSQAVDFIQSKPKLAGQVAEAPCRILLISTEGGMTTNGASAT